MQRATTGSGGFGASLSVAAGLLAAGLRLGERVRVANAAVGTAAPRPSPALSLGRESMRPKTGFDNRVGPLTRAADRRRAARRAARPVAGLAQCATRRPLTAGITGAGRSWTACTISVLSIPRKYTDVTPRSACPNWRCITTSGTPSRDISTA